jgi:hypothetical protein
MLRVEEWSFFSLSASLANPRAVSDAADSLNRLLFSQDGVLFSAAPVSAALGKTAQSLRAQNGQPLALGLSFREFPLSIAWVVNGFGFALWSNTAVEAEISETAAKTTVYSDVLLPVGFAFKLIETEEHSLDGGFTLKPFVRVLVRENLSIDNLLNNTADNPATPVIAGGGLDLGFLYRWSGGFQAGLTFANVLSNGTVAANLTDTADNSAYYIPLAVNAGVSYTHRLSSDFAFTFAADWRDIGAAENRDARLNFGAGAEVSLFDKLYFRVGMNEMLPSAGAGIHLGVLKIDAAVYGREFGEKPGQLSTAAVDLSVSIRPRAEAKSWSWAETPLLNRFGFTNAKTENAKPANKTEIKIPVIAEKIPQEENLPINEGEISQEIPQEGEV